MKLKKLVKELYSIKDDKTVDLSHRRFRDIFYRETLKTLQFSGNTRLESLLELIKSKMDNRLCNIGMKTTVHFFATSAKTDSDRLDKLENMVENLTE